MMNRIYLLSLSLVYLLACASANSSDVFHITAQELAAHPEKYNNARVVVSGYIGVETKIARFFVSKDAATPKKSKGDPNSIIDIYSDDKVKDKSLSKLQNGSCIVLVGDFKKYDPKHGFIGFGNFVSNIGVIDVTDIQSCG